MKIVVTSEKPLKMNAVKTALEANGITNFELVGVKAESGVKEQPFDGETVEGARNRNADAQRQIPDAAAYVSMENGQFLQKDGTYLDKAAVVITKNDGKQTETVAYDEGLPITDPALVACVNESKRLKESGERDVTATDIMVERGLVPAENSKDPHQYLSGKPRTDYLAEGVDKAVKDAFPKQIKAAQERTTGQQHYR